MKHLFSACIIFYSIVGFSQDSTNHRKNIIKIDALLPSLFLTIKLVNSPNITTSGPPPLNISYARRLSESIQFQTNLFVFLYQYSWDQINEDHYAESSSYGYEKQSIIYSRPEVKYFLYHDADKLKKMYINAGILIGYLKNYRKEDYVEDGTDFYSSRTNEYLMTGVGVGLGYQFLTLKNRLVIDVNGTVQAIYYTETKSLLETNDSSAIKFSTPSFLPEISCSIGYSF